MPWDEFSKARLARLPEREPGWVARRLLAIGLERGLVSRNAADVLVAVGAGPVEVALVLVDGSEGKGHPALRLKRAV